MQIVYFHMRQYIYIKLWYFVCNLPQHQGCQLPDSSLRFQNICYTADFSTTFLYMPKIITFSHPIAKKSSKNPRIPVFLLYFSIRFLGAQTEKREDRPFSAGTSCAWAGRWPAVMRTLKHFAKFSDFLRHNFGNQQQPYSPCRAGH